MRHVALAAAFSLALAGCASTRTPAEPLAPAAPAALAGVAEPLRSILASRAQLARTLHGAQEHRIQIVLGLLEPDADGKPYLRQIGFRGAAEYFYPASAVKTFAAIAALEGLSELRADTGLAIDRDTPLVLYPLFEGEKVEEADPSHLADGTITVGHEIRKLAIVSDNEAFNRLFELVGQDGLARSLARAGLAEPRIVHRLAEPRTAAENLQAPRIDFRGTYFRHTIPERTAIAMPPQGAIPGLLVGTGYLADDKLVDGPMDFSAKNRMTLAELQRGLCKLVRPDVACGAGPSFRLDESDRDFLVDAMTRLPRESKDPRFDPVTHPDASAKLLLPGLEREIPRGRLRLVSKYGQAYGFSTDNAWIEDLATGRGVFLAATIYTNADGILNDDLYEYADVALPFFAELGRAIGSFLRVGDQPKKR